MMKKEFLIFLSLIFILCLVSCNSKIEENKKTLKEEIDEKINLRIESNKYYCNANTINLVVEDLVSNKENVEEVSADDIFSNVDNLFLDLEVLEQIKSDFEKQYGHKFFYDDFYGCYSDAYFFFQEGDAQKKTDVIISDAMFRYNCDWTIYVWHQNQFYEIDDAFEKDIFSHEILNQIAQIHYLKSINNITI